MNLKTARTMNRAHRRILLNAAKNKVKAEVLAARMAEEITVPRATGLIRDIDACRNLGHLHRASCAIQMQLRDLKHFVTP